MVRVEVFFSATARQVDQVPLTLPAGATVRDAVAAAGLLARHGLLEQAVQCGVWGRRCSWSQVVREGDRVELYRELTVDPKEARRLRYKGQRKAKRPAGAGR
jgi:putative ubiquitin-RnfH superfamily antitoxin RatB of RatAB toxin-antitoxin module